MAKCFYCGQMPLMTARTGLTLIGKNPVCPDCIAERYVRCPDCGQYALSEAMKTKRLDYLKDGTKYKPKKITLYDYMLKTAIHDPLDHIDVSVCPTCARNYITCKDCGAGIQKTTIGAALLIDTGHVCPDCAKNYPACKQCGKVKMSQHMIKIKIGHGQHEYVCSEKCLVDRYGNDVQECELCGDRVITAYFTLYSHPLSPDNKHYVCHDHVVRGIACACGHLAMAGEESHIPVRLSAGSEIDADGVLLRSENIELPSHLKSLPEGETVCSSCICYYTRSPSATQFIHGYLHSVPLCFHGSLGAHLGVELETDTATSTIGKKAEATAKAVYKAVGQKHVMIKRDGSLDCGFEMVTHPATLEYMLSNKARYDNLCDIPRAAGFLSHNIGTCGLHVHVSRNYFTEQEVALFGVITEIFWPELFIFSRRDAGTAARWANRKLKMPAQLKLNAGCLDDIFDYFVRHNIEVCGSGHNGPRYATLNLCNVNTIEIRIFRGTLNKTTFWATLQLVDNLCRTVKGLTIDKLKTLSWPDIVNYCEYPELKKYNAQTVGEGWKGGKHKLRSDTDTGIGYISEISIPLTLPKSITEADEYIQVKSIDPLIASIYKKYPAAIGQDGAASYQTTLSEGQIFLFSPKGHRISYADNQFWALPYPLFNSAVRINTFYLNKSKIKDKIPAEILELLESYPTVDGIYLPE